MSIKIIVEPSIVWRGNVDLLNQLATEAIAYGADIFKCQFYDTKRMGNAWIKKKPFYDKCQFTQNTLADLREHVEGWGAEFLVTVNSPSLFSVARDAGVVNIKLASGQLLPEMFTELNKYNWNRVVISTGMLFDASKLEMIKVVNVSELVVMHCISLYPPAEIEMNMRRIETLRDYYMGTSVKIGYSDHYTDDLPSVGAMFMGAEYIERHVSREGCFGPTSEICCTMDEFKVFSSVRRRVERLLGDGAILSCDREKGVLEHYATRWLT